MKVRARQDAAARRAIENYCAGIDRLVRAKATYRVASASRRAQQAAPVPGASATPGANQEPQVESRMFADLYKDQWVYVEHSTVATPGRPANFIRYYFYPNGLLAKSRMELKAFTSSRLNGQLLVVMEAFQDRKGRGVGRREGLYNPATRKKVPHVLYSAPLYTGARLSTVLRLQDLRMYEQLVAARAKYLQGTQTNEGD